MIILDRVEVAILKTLYSLTSKSSEWVEVHVLSDAMKESGVDPLIAGYYTRLRSLERNGWLASYKEATGDTQTMFVRLTLKGINGVTGKNPDLYGLGGSNRAEFILFMGIGTALGLLFMILNLIARSWYLVPPAIIVPLIGAFLSLILYRGKVLYKL